MDPNIAAQNIAPQIDHRIDHLTGLYNREWFDTTLAEEEINNPGDFAVVFIDLNGLKAINDGEGGHAAGDRFLQSAGQVISDSIRVENSPEHEGRPTDGFVYGGARLGGDEFALILRGCKTDDDVDAVTARLTESFLAKNISASMGGRIHNVDEPVSELLADADKRMYAEKQAHYAQKRAVQEQLDSEKIEEQLGELNMRKRIALRLSKIAFKATGLEDPSVLKR